MKFAVSLGQSRLHLRCRLLGVVEARGCLGGLYDAKNTDEGRPLGVGGASVRALCSRLPVDGTVTVPFARVFFWCLGSALATQRDATRSSHFFPLFFPGLSTSARMNLGGCRFPGRRVALRGFVESKRERERKKRRKLP
jgi:hypothetical protein